VTTRWLYHALLRTEWERVAESYAPESLAREGFVHASYRDVVEASARLYVAPRGACVIVRIDPRAVRTRLAIVDTPRGPMPHVRGAIPREAIVETTDLDAWDASRAPDVID
jgi:uncharacterized protein (DUF952 family)